MSKQQDKLSEQQSQFKQQIDSKVQRKLKAEQNKLHTIWSGLGMMGLIGWSVVLPTLLGTALGVWIDKNHPSEHSWTLALLMMGLTLGCANAWHWVEKERQAMHKDSEDSHD